MKKNSNSDWTVPLMLSILNSVDGWLKISSKERPNKVMMNLLTKSSARQCVSMRRKIWNNFNQEHLSSCMLLHKHSKFKRNKKPLEKERKKRKLKLQLLKSKLLLNQHIISHINLTSNTENNTSLSKRKLDHQQQTYEKNQYLVYLIRNYCD